MQNFQLFKTFCFAVIALALVSCGEEKKERPVKNGIDAEILNLQDSTLYFYSLTNTLDQVKGKEPSFHLEIETDSNGIFVRPLDLEEGYYYLEYDHFKSLYFIQKGKRLSLDFDVQKPSVQPEFSGKLKYESRYLYTRYLEHAQFKAKEASYFDYAEKDFVKEVTQMRGRLDTALVVYITNHPTGSEYFMQQESLTNLYFMAAYLEAFPSRRKAIEGELPALSAKYYDLLNTLNVNDTAARNNPEFFTYIQNYVWARSGEPSSTGKVNQQIAFVDSVFTVQDYKDYLRFKAAKEVATWETSEDRKMALDTLVGLVKNQEIQEFLVKNIQNDTASLPNFNHAILEDQ